MKKVRAIFYTGLIGIFPVFLLLHWNGMFAQTYYWALQAVEGTRSFLPQLIFSTLSAVVIFAVVALLFEGVTRTARYLVK